MHNVEGGDSEEGSPRNQDAIQGGHDVDEQTVSAFLDAPTGVRGQGAESPAEQNDEADDAGKMITGGGPGFTGRGEGEAETETDWTVGAGFGSQED